MDIRLIYCAAAIILALISFHETALSQTPSGAITRSPDIQTLDDKVMAAKDWKKVGFDSPQKTAQTFMWALREK